MVEPRNSSTIRRLVRTRSLSVCTTMPGSALREHDGTSVREPLDLDHAHPAGVLGGQRLAVAQGRDLALDSSIAAGLQQGRPLGDLGRLTVDGDLDHPPRRADCHFVHDMTPSLASADSMALCAVWPRPQIDASRIT